MHTCFMLFTKEKPTYEEIEKILEPYYEDTVYDNYFNGDAAPKLMWDWYTIGGRYSHILEGNESLPASEVKDYDNLSTYGCIDVDGTGYAKEYWDTKDWIVEPDYWDRLKEIKERNKDCWVTILDLHD